MLKPLSRRFSLRGLVTLCVTFSALAASGAEFHKSALSNEGPDLITIEGEFVLGDERKFIDLALSSQNALVMFKSPGGDLNAGIKIGEAIHLKGFATFVPDNLLCASACALAWLGGRVRLMSDTARVGFHAAYIKNNGEMRVSGSANALVGAYLNQLGLPADAIFYITDAPPEGIKLLSFADAQRYGIDVNPMNISSVPSSIEQTAPTPNAQHTTSEAVLAAIKIATYDFMTITNQSNDRVLSYLEGKYTSQVSYYGKILEKDLVIADKRKYFQRWPARNFSVRPDSILVVCQSKVFCTSKGILDWTVSGKPGVRTGSSSFSLTWRSEDGNWKIAEQKEQILSISKRQ